MSKNSLRIINPGLLPKIFEKVHNTIDLTELTTLIKSSRITLSLVTNRLQSLYLWIAISNPSFCF